MGAVAHFAAVVVYGERGVVVFLVGDPGDDIYESEGLVVIFEVIGAVNFGARCIDLPSLRLPLYLLSGKLALR